MQESDQWGGNLTFRGGKQQNTSVALLRVAYLMFFRLFGYGAILDPVIAQIRQQVFNPDTPLFPSTWNVPKWLANTMPLGVSIVREPEELRSFVAVFDLKRPTGVSRYGVLLPTLDSTGPSLYQRLDELHGKRLDGEFHAQLIPSNIDFWTKASQVFMASTVSLVS
jgi:hypothetical protein